MSSTRNTGSDADAAQLASLGYQQQLSRRLGLITNFSVGFTHMSPVVSVYALFAFGLTTAGAAFIWTVPVVVIGQLLVLLVIAEVASMWPIAGGIYQWAKRLVNPQYAWMAGWFYVWAILTAVASVAFSSVLFIGPLLGYEVTKTSTVVTSLILLAVGGVANLLGSKFLAVISAAGMAAEIGGTVILGGLLLTVGAKNDLGTLFESQGAGSTASSYVMALMIAGLISLWSFYGFETCGDVAEEVKNPSRQVPRAMLMTLFVGGAVVFFTIFSFILATPDIGAVVRGEGGDPIVSALTANFGEFGAKVALVMVLIAFISCVLSGQAAATRLIFSFARDGMLPGSSVLSRVSERVHMPVGAVVLAVIIPAGIVLMPTATVSRIIAFAVIGIYISFGFVVAGALWARLHGWTPDGAWSLPARVGSAVAVGALLWVVSVVAFLSLETPASGAGFLDRWLVPFSALAVGAVGLLYMLIARPKFAAG